MKRIKALLTLFALIGISPATAQTVDTTRVIKLPSFDLIAYRWYSETLSPEALDSSSVKIQRGQTVSQAINKAGSNFIRSYGPGRLTSYSIEGASTGQSLVLWNGVPIQNPMNAYTDLSLFEHASFDLVQQKNTSNYSQYGNGAMVSSLSFLNQKPIDKSSQSAFIEGGSFNSLRAGLSYSKRKDKYAFTSRLNLQHADSNYSYNLANGSTKKLANAENSSINLQLSLWAKGKGTKSKELHFWGHASDKNIPNPFATIASQQSQKDQFVQLLFRQRNTPSSRRQFINTFHYQINLNDYANELTGIQNDNLFHSISYDLKYNHTPKINGGFKQQVHSASTEAYSSPKQLWISSLFLQGNVFAPQRAFQLFGGLRTEWSNQAGASLGGNLAVSYRFTPSTDLSLHADRTFRYPSLNDLYWTPGGREDLSPEKAISQKLLLNIQSKRNYTQFKIFNRFTENLILWIPQSGIWQAENIQSVWARGLDLNGNIKILEQKKQRLRLRYQAAWTKSTNRSKTSANDRSQGKQLIYIPQYTAAYFIDIVRNQYQLNLSHNFSSRIFTSRDNSSYLAGFDLIDLRLSRRFYGSNSQWTFAIDLRNLLGKDYQLSLGWPMPRRGIYLKIIYQNH